MKLGDKIRDLRESIGHTQGQLADSASVSQGYLSQLENGDVKNPSAAVLLRVAQAMRVDADELFEAAGYPTVRTLRQAYEDYESSIDPDLLRYLGRLPRDRQRRLLLLLESMETVVLPGEVHKGEAVESVVEKGEANGRLGRTHLRSSVHSSGIRG